MNYYFNYNTGLIDGLLTRLGIEDYAFAEGTQDPRANEVPNDLYMKSRTLGKKVKRNNVLQSNVMVGGPITEKSRNTGHKTEPIDKYLRNWLHKQAMEAVLEDFDYDHEYYSPFDNNINKLLLILKWITGIQSITRNMVEITKEDLKAIDMDHKSVMDIKIAFDKLFYNSIVYSSYDAGTWSIKLGTRDLKVGEGPGFINMRIDIPHLVTKITEYHTNLKQNHQS